MPQLFSGVAAFDSHEFNFTGKGDPREIEAVYTSPELFPVLGIAAELGRTFSDEDERAPYVVLSHRLWATVYGSDPAVLGQSLQLDGAPYTVIGVMPSGFQFPSEDVELWVPLGGAFAANPDAQTSRGMHFFNSVARLQPGVTPERLRGDLATLAQRLQAAQDANPSQERQMRITGRGASPAGGGAPRPGPSAARAGSGGAFQIGFDAVPLTD